ncbi:SPOR domain-containing protein [Methyloceanibacter stevinii]|uniref:SPOR domain-containing protein n=1 Tax=Methyloceanibacter stevinii TaxID=1774970 RepID=UPI00187557EA|nr:SPOR domain-containing protein [Methyloceanibacter stevinii]
MATPEPPKPAVAAAPAPPKPAEPAPPPPAPPVAAAAPPAAPAQTQVVEERTDVAALDPVALPPAANDGSTRYGIEIGSVAKRDELRPLWREYLTKHAALVAGLQPRRVRGPDNGWRLIAGPFANAQDAEGACSLFKRADRPCAATVYAGDAL